MTFLSALLFDNLWLYHLEVRYLLSVIIKFPMHLFYWSSRLQTQVTWNSSNIPHQFMPPDHTYTCVESTLYPTPGPVEDLIVVSCATNGSYVTLHLEWSPPSSAITVEIDSYDVCIGVSVESDLEMLPLDSGNLRQCSNFNFNVC